MLDGVMLLWFVLTAMSLLFVAIDIRTTPESTVLKWGFVLLTAYTGPFGAFLYVLGCREPLPGMHERYVAVRWRQVLGSTMHCVAGDGVGILAGAVIASVYQLPTVTDIALEYLLGFGFGWAIFQALFMRDEAGGSYSRALAKTFVPELLSMNCLMAGMVPTMTLVKSHVSGSHDPSGPVFWFVMSMSLLVGFVIAYPMNWWLVSHHMKHGMMTVRTSDRPAMTRTHEGMQEHHSSDHETDNMQPMHDTAMHGDARKASQSCIVWMATLSFMVFAAGLVIAATFVGV
jgi:Domain of unknown function (DUF4396)